MKTGTTYLQHRMLANRAPLAAQGVDFVGEKWAEQVRATQDLLGLGGTDPQIARLAEGAWPRTVARMLAHDGVASVLSMEFLSFANAEDAARAVAAFGDAEVHVVLTLRDAAAVIPAQWQTSVTSGGVDDWPTFQRGVRRSAGLGGAAVGLLTRDQARRAFLEAQDVVRMVSAWGPPLVPPERFHVVTVPLPGAPKDLLWERFCAAAGIDPTPCTAEAKKSNESLGYASTELVRRVNLTLDLDSPVDHNKTVKDHLAHKALAPRRRLEDRARLDPATYSFALEWNARVREAVRDAGVRVVGDLSELPVDTADAGHVEVTEVQEPPSEEAVLDAARAAYPVMRDLVGRRARKMRSLGRKPRTKKTLERLVRPRRWGRQPDPTAAAVADLVLLCRVAIRLRRRIRGA